MSITSLNNGTYTLFKSTHHGYLYERKLLEIIDAVPIGTFCFCGNYATFIYNNHNLCIKCYDRINYIVHNKKHYIYKNTKLFYVGNNNWFSGKIIKRDYNYNFICKEKKFISNNPKILLEIIYLGKKQRTWEVNCTYCLKYIDCPYSGGYNVICYNNNFLCLECKIKTKLYFNLNVKIYWFLKNIITKDPAINAVLYYYYIKLTNCHSLIK